MKFKSRTPFAASLIAAACLFGASSAMADAVIFNGGGTAATATIALGVKGTGALNTFTDSVAANSGATGLAYKFADGRFYDATSPGCLCEGWGVSATTPGGPESGFDGNGFSNLTVNSFVSGASTATSVVSLSSLPGLTVTHDISPAGGALFKAVVTITNGTADAISDVRYVRVMDWDVPPTEFDEFVTIQGTATTTLLERSHDNGFNGANPLGGDSPIDPATADVDFADNGPDDHGAYFRFNFGSLAAGESYTFNIFYGATGDEASALAAIGAAGIELFSLGQNSRDPSLGTPATFIFGFSGVGGVCQGDDCNVPEPGSLALVGLGLLGAGALRRRGSRRQA